MYISDNTLTTWRISYRWSILVAMFAALFWGVWYLILGSVPVSSELSPELARWIPSHLSRWWDILAWPLLVFSFSWFISLLVIATDADWLFETLTHLTGAIGLIFAIACTAIDGLQALLMVMLLTPIGVVVVNVIAYFVALALWTVLRLTWKGDSVGDWLSGE